MLTEELHPDQWLRIIQFLRNCPGVYVGQEENCRRFLTGILWIAEPVPSVPDHLALSEREVEVLQLLAKGSANKQIAGDLSITESTVKTHVANIFQKLEVSHRT